MSSKAIVLPFAILMFATIAVECQSKNTIFNQVAEVFFCLFSTVMHSPGPAFLECTGSCRENVPAQKAISFVCESADFLDKEIGRPKTNYNQIA